ncbi:hypothetical protein BaRGS_00003721 [Batillaria attramentaria]|uniref:Uncharacterized protein n=1 Tax=Batillaria attramentaria TaxID=370345 RepID=A0ABD0M0D3_9CAEN
MDENITDYLLGFLAYLLVLCYLSVFTEHSWIRNEFCVKNTRLRRGGIGLFDDIRHCGVGLFGTYPGKTPYEVFGDGYNPAIFWITRIFVLVGVTATCMSLMLLPHSVCIGCFPARRVIDWLCLACFSVAVVSTALGLFIFGTANSEHLHSGFWLVVFGCFIYVIFYPLIVMQQRTYLVVNGR